MLYRKRVQMCIEVMWSAYGHPAGQSCEYIRHQGNLIDLFSPRYSHVKWSLCLVLVNIIFFQFYCFIYIEELICIYQQ